MARKTESEILEAIKHCETILDAGATTITQDGHTTVFDLDKVSDRLRDLRKELAVVRGKSARRPLFTRINLGE